MGRASMRSALSFYTRAAQRNRPPAPSGDQLEPVRLLTVAEACAELRVSKWTLYQYIHSRQLASVKLRSRRLIPRDAIRELIEKLKIEAIA
jgi:excisionase family DNA binding protein